MNEEAPGHPACRMLSQQQRFRRVRPAAWLAAVGSRPIYVEIFAQYLFNGLGLVLMRGVCVCVCVCVFKFNWGLPWWLSGKQSSCECRRHRFDPWSGKIPCAAKHLSPCAATTEPTCHNYWSLHAREPCSTTREATAARSLNTARKSSPHLPQ